MALLGALILVMAVVAFILQPVIQGHWASLTQQDDEMTEVEARRRVSLLALRDAEYDYVTGKLDEDDYRALKRQLSAEALAAFKELEESGDNDALEREIAAARRGLRDGMKCGGCQHRNPPGSRFCGSCGTSLEVRQTVAAP